MRNHTKILHSDELPDICTPQNCADYLGISRNTVYLLCQISPQAGGMPSYQIGGSRKIDKADLLRWKEAQKQQSQKTLLSYEVGTR